MPVASAASPKASEPSSSLDGAQSFHWRANALVDAAAKTAAYSARAPFHLRRRYHDFISAATYGAAIAGAACYAANNHHTMAVNDAGGVSTVTLRDSAGRPPPSAIRTAAAPPQTRPRPTAEPKPGKYDSHYATLPSDFPLNESAIALPMAVALSTSEVHGPASIAQPEPEDACRTGSASTRPRGSTAGGAGTRARSTAALRRKAGRLAVPARRPLRGRRWPTPSPTLRLVKVTSRVARISLRLPPRFPSRFQRDQACARLHRAHSWPLGRHRPASAARPPERSRRPA